MTVKLPPIKPENYIHKDLVHSRHDREIASQLRYANRKEQIQYRRAWAWPPVNPPISSGGSGPTPAPPRPPPGPSQPCHHLLHPLLADVGVNLGGGDALVAEQRLDVHPFRPGVEQVRGVSMPQLVRADLLFDAGLVQHPAQIGAGRLWRHRFWPFALAKTASPRSRSFNQNPNTAPKAPGRGARRSWLPFPTTRRQSQVPRHDATWLVMEKSLDQDGDGALPLAGPGTPLAGVFSRARGKKGRGYTLKRLTAPPWRL